MLMLVPVLLCAAAQAPADYEFEGAISRPVLENYLARSMTVLGLLHEADDFDENLRMIENTGAKFLGRAIYRWGREQQIVPLVEQAAPLVRKAHARDPERVFQAAVFEIVTTKVNEVAVPPHVFEAFGRAPEERAFRYADMLYPDGHRVDHWREGASVPDMSRLETRMWFFYACSAYIGIGCEAIHFGQVEIMDGRDPSHAHWRDMLGKVRAYAAEHARRGMVLCDAHVPSGGIAHGGKLMFDLHSFPLRIDEVPGEPHKGVLKMGYLDSIFGRSKGGITPSGWSCGSLPFIVELDNFEASGRGGENVGGHWIWGWDEISWFANQPEDYRNEWLEYAWDWVRAHDPNGFLQMPGLRGGYRCNTRSEAAPNGFNQEETIKRIWAGKQ